MGEAQQRNEDQRWLYAAAAEGEAHLVTSSVSQTREEGKGLLTKGSVGLLLEDDVVDLRREPVQSRQLRALQVALIISCARSPWPPYPCCSSTSSQRYRPGGRPTTLQCPTYHCPRDGQWMTLALLRRGGGPWYRGLEVEGWGREEEDQLFGSHEAKASSGVCADRDHASHAVQAVDLLPKLSPVLRVELCPSSAPPSSK